MFEFFDTHCHIDFAQFDRDRKAVLQRAYDAGVRHIIVPGTSHSEQVKLPLESPIQFHFAVGLHPYFIEQHQVDDCRWLEQQLGSDPTLLVGEIGLDRTRPKYAWQLELFEQQIALAATYQRPVILHHRKTQADLLRVIDRYRSALPAVAGCLHAFSGSYEQGLEWVRRGFKLGVGGTITYPRAKKTRAACARLPLEALVLETDAPDMPIFGHQGERNEPASVADVFAALVELRTESPAHMAAQLWRNSQTLLR